MIKNQINKTYDNVVQETLIAARLLLSDNSSWGRFGFAGTSKDKYNEMNDEVEPTSEKAQCWCGAGAIKAFKPSKAIEEQCGNMLFIAADILGIDEKFLSEDDKEHVDTIEDISPEAIEDFYCVNDGEDYETVIKVFDAAIALCEA